MKADIRAAAAGLFDPKFVEVPEAEVPLADAISSYLFNSQLLAWPGEDRLVLLAPTETEDTASTRAYCERLVEGNGPIGRVEYVDVRQSMRNGGGPACLRLRVALTDDQLAAVNPVFLLNDARIDDLVDWVSAHYRDRLAQDDLADPAFFDEVQSAMDELDRLLQAA